MACCKSEKFAQPVDSLFRSAGDDQAIHSIIWSKRRRKINTAIFRVGLAHGLNRLGIDTLCGERVIRPTRRDVRDKTLGVLARGFAVA